MNNAHLEALVSRGLLPARTAEMEWQAPRAGKMNLSPPEGYVVRFLMFQHPGFAATACRFLHEVRHHFALGPVAVMD